MSKMHYFSKTNFSKSPSADGSPPPMPLCIRFWWLKVA